MLDGSIQLSEAQPRTLSIQVHREPLPILSDEGVWDELLSRSASNTIFLTSAWLRSALEAYGRNAEFFLPVIYIDQTLVAAAAFLYRNGYIEFLGTGPSDYLDVVLDMALNQEEKQSYTVKLLTSVLEVVPNFKAFRLKNCLTDTSSLCQLFECGHKGFYFTQLRTEIAPMLEMRFSNEKLKKKSLRRHENKLMRMGKLSCVTYTTEEEIQPRLDNLFDQHVRRWEGTKSPSQFNKLIHREFYKRLIKNFDNKNWLRFTEIRLNEQLIAVHFGAHYAGSFIWYKPSYEPEYAEFSPGEVLLKRLIEFAMSEGAQVFDFTVGDEAFKHRFATQIREIKDIHVTQSFWRALMLRVYLFTKKILRGILSSAGIWEWLKGFKK